MFVVRVCGGRVGMSRQVPAGSSACCAGSCGLACAWDSCSLLHWLETGLRQAAAARAALPRAQDWTQQVNEATEGMVEYTYRIEPDTRPPDIQKITKQMAIVAWQPGPNRILQVPTEVRGREGTWCGAAAGQCQQGLRGAWAHPF